MKSWLVALFLISPFAHGQEAALKGLLTQFTSSQLKPTVECTDDELHQKCAVDLCGPASKVPSFFNFIDQLENGTPTAISPAATARLEKLINSNLSRQRQMIKAFSKMKLDDSEYSQWSDYEWSNSANNTFQRFYYLNTDFSKPLASRNSYQFHPIDKNFKSGMDSYMKDLDKLIKTNPLDMSLGEIRYSILTPQEIKAEALKKIDQVLASPNLSPVVQAEFNNLKATTATFQDDQVRTFLQKLDILLTDANFRSTSLCTDQACRQSVKDLKKLRVKSVMKQLTDRYRDPHLNKKALATCTSALMIPAEKKAQIESFQHKIPGLLENFINKGMQGASDHSKQAFRKFYQDNISPYFGLRDVNDIKQIDDYEKSMDAHPLMPEEGDELETAESLLFDGPMGQVPLCASYVELPIAGDAYALDSRKSSGRLMLISPFSCQHTAYGESIFSHELGHALSDAHKQNGLSPNSKIEFQKMRDCSKISHPTDQPAQPGVLFHQGDNLYTEEDTADLHAFRSNPDGLTFSCALLKPSLDKQAYENLSLIGAPGDNHSPGLLRAIRETHFKDKPLPASCKQLMDSDTQGLKLNKCQ